MSDVTISRSPRTYPLPRSITDEVQLGQQWAAAYDYKLSDAEEWISSLLASGGSFTEDMIGIVASCVPEQPEIGDPTDPDYPNVDRIRWALFGGTPMQRWSGKVLVASAQKVQDRLTQTLTDLDYKSDLTYIGICDAQDDSLVRTLVRVGTDHTQWERWSPADKHWEPIDYGDISTYDAFELDEELTAVTAAALAETDGLLLMFDEPIARLPFEPITAAAPDDVQGVHYYAVVDSTDTSAVMNVVAISPGPVVRTRQAGKWTVDDKTLGLLTGIQPPPLVELDPQQLKMVLAQVDSGAVAAQENPDNVESLGNEDAINAKNQAAAAGDDGGQGPVSGTDAVAASGLVTAIFEYESMRDAELGMIAGLEGALDDYDSQKRSEFDAAMDRLRESGTDDEITALQRSESARRDELAGTRESLSIRREAADIRCRKLTAEAVLASASDTRIRQHVIETLVNAVPITAATGGADRNRGNAEVLRRYWLHGKGALKIRWGTSGDWTRCYRHLRKYLGVRAKGYCQLRHKDANGFYTGSRLNK